MSDHCKNFALIKLGTKHIALLQSLGRTQNWIKLGGKVKRNRAKSARSAFHWLFPAMPLQCCGHISSGNDRSTLAPERAHFASNDLTPHLRCAHTSIKATSCPDPKPWQINYLNDKNELFNNYLTCISRGGAGVSSDACDRDSKLGFLPVQDQGPP